MKVVLLKNHTKLGQAGDIKEVANGYALNYLIPQKIAAELNKHTLGMLEAQKNKQVRLETKSEAGRLKLAKRITNKTYIIKAKADDKGTLYAGLDAKAVAQELALQKVPLEPKEIKLDKAIKRVGDYKIKIQLAKNIVFINLKITASD